MARAQKVRAIDLMAAGVVDRIVPELPDAADAAEAFCLRLGVVLEHELSRLFHADPAELVATRSLRFATAPPLDN